MLEQMVDWFNTNGFEHHAVALCRCGRKSVIVSDDADHCFARPIRCHRIFCPTCGEKDSESHRRRYGRAWDRLVPFQTLGYVVLTIPSEWRDRFRSQAELRSLHQLAWECVERVFGAKGGMTALHFFGDKSAKYHPHANVLFPVFGKAFVSVEQLIELRQVWREILEAHLGVDIPEEQENAYYSYARATAQRVHKIKYVTRSSVPASLFMELDEEDKRLIAGLFRFHNQRWWGRLSNRCYAEYLEELHRQGRIEDYQRRKREFTCPICHQKLRSTGVVNLCLDAPSLEWIPAGQGGLYANVPTFIALRQKRE
ncbi:hypothetical protein HYR99_41365 [Candidatus Poribacteria bacterium]|nr:hypothetical protein [Candidatus Poribacteria bacterium]